MAQVMDPRVTPPAVVASKVEVGDRIYLLRHERRLTLDKIEEVTGIPASTVSRWERGAAAGYPPIERLAQLARLYDVTVPELLAPASTTRVWSKAA